MAQAIFWGQKLEFVVYSTMRMRMLHSVCGQTYAETDDQEGDEQDADDRDDDSGRQLTFGQTVIAVVKVLDGCANATGDHAGIGLVDLLSES